MPDLDAVIEEVTADMFAAACGTPLAPSTVLGWRERLLAARDDYDRAARVAKPQNDPLRVFGHAVGMALTDRKVPVEWDADNLTPAQMLDATAGLLDRLDDATDAYVAASGGTETVVRSMQRDIRAIARTLSTEP